jgi:hypothetical protein
LKLVFYQRAANKDECQLFTSNSEREHKEEDEEDEEEQPAGKQWGLTDAQKKLVDDLTKRGR